MRRAARKPPCRDPSPAMASGSISKNSARPRIVGGTSRDYGVSIVTIVYKLAPAGHRGGERKETGITAERDEYVVPLGKRNLLSHLFQNSPPRPADFRIGRLLHNLAQLRPSQGTRFQQG